MIKTITKHHVFSVLNKAGGNRGNFGIAEEHIFTESGEKKFYQKRDMTRIII